MLAIFRARGPLKISPSQTQIGSNHCAPDDPFVYRESRTSRIAPKFVKFEFLVGDSLFSIREDSETDIWRSTGHQNSRTPFDAKQARSRSECGPHTSDRVPRNIRPESNRRQSSQGCIHRPQVPELDLRAPSPRLRSDLRACMSCRGALPRRPQVHWSEQPPLIPILTRPRFQKNESCQATLKSGQPFRGRRIRAFRRNLFQQAQARFQLLVRLCGLFLAVDVRPTDDLDADRDIAALFRAGRSNACTAFRFRLGRWDRALPAWRSWRGDNVLRRTASMAAQAAASATCAELLAIGCVPYKSGKMWAPPMDRFGSYYRTLRTLKRSLDPKSLFCPDNLAL